VSLFVVLAAASVLGVWALFIALVLFLRQISATLEDIGGPATRFFRPSNFLGSIRLGVRAIETQTAALGPAVTQLNGGLSAVRDGLKVIDGNLAGVIEGASSQTGGR
jgi:hypothetical protein